MLGDPWGTPDAKPRRVLIQLIAGGVGELRYAGAGEGEEVVVHRHRWRVTAQSFADCGFLVLPLR